MSTRLSDLLAPQVSRKSRARGHEYFASGAVRDIHLADGAIVARVVGGQTYDVVLESERNELRVSCTCPFFYDSFEVCKHIWAAVLAAESRHLSLVGADAVPALITLHPTEPDAPAEGFEDDILDSFAAGSWSSRARRSTPPPPRREPRPKSTPPAAWQQLLGAVTAPPTTAAPAGRAPVAPEQLMYVID